MKFHAILRIKNEARWIKEVVRALQPLCEAIHIFDDHSTDDTAEICDKLGAGVMVYRSPFTGLDESRDKDFLLQRVIETIPADQFGADSQHFVCCIDGDEVLAPGHQTILRETVARGGFAWRLRVVYLWDSPQQWRADGVYANFCRPSVFRLINPRFRFQKTPFGNGANFHCSSIPQEMLHHGAVCDAVLLHLGYMYREDRVRKYEWYNLIDPHNEGEDCYRHIVQGDIPQVPADARLKHAGPMRLAIL